jgi:hypothetical protein
VVESTLPAAKPPALAAAASLPAWLSRRPAPPTSSSAAGGAPQPGPAPPALAAPAASAHCASALRQPLAATTQGPASPVAVLPRALDPATLQGLHEAWCWAAMRSLLPPPQTTAGAEAALRLSLQLVGVAAPPHPPSPAPHTPGPSAPAAPQPALLGPRLGPPAAEEAGPVRLVASVYPPCAPPAGAERLGHGGLTSGRHGQEESERHLLVVVVSEQQPGRLVLASARPLANAVQQGRDGGGAASVGLGGDAAGWGVELLRTSSDAEATALRCGAAAAAAAHGHSPTDSAAELLSFDNWLVLVQKPALGAAASAGATSSSAQAAMDGGEGLAGPVTPPRELVQGAAAAVPAAGVCRVPVGAASPALAGAQGPSRRGRFTVLA